MIAPAIEARAPKTGGNPLRRFPIFWFGVHWNFWRGNYVQRLLSKKWAVTERQSIALQIWALALNSEPEC